MGFDFLKFIFRDIHECGQMCAIGPSPFCLSWSELETYGLLHEDQTIWQTAESLRFHTYAC